MSSFSHALASRKCTHIFFAGFRRVTKASAASICRRPLFNVVASGNPGTNVPIMMTTTTLGCNSFFSSSFAACTVPEQSIDWPSTTTTLDRIFLRNYVRDMEIGVLEEEYGVTQRVRFDVTLEVTPYHPPPPTTTRPTTTKEDETKEKDDDDSEVAVVSYVHIVTAIDELICNSNDKNNNSHRYEWLEVLGHDICTKCLAVHRQRVQRVHVQIEKLDRLTGDAGLGIAMTRDQPATPTE